MQIAQCVWHDELLLQLRSYPLMVLSNYPEWRSGQGADPSIGSPRYQSGKGTPQAGDMGDGACTVQLTLDT